MSDADLGLEYRGGIAAPDTEEIGNTPRAIASVAGEPSVLEYPPEQQTLAGSGTWDGRARSVAVGGSGARPIALPTGSFIGQTVDVFDAAGNAGSGTITVDPDGSATVNGASTTTLTTNFQVKRLRYMATNAWIAG
jgi:hypothetical protein